MPLGGANAVAILGITSLGKPTPACEGRTTNTRDSPGCDREISYTRLLTLPSGTPELIMS